MNEMDFRNLLRRYMANVIAEESVSLLGRSWDYSDEKLQSSLSLNGLSDEEFAELEKIEKEIRAEKGMRT